MNCQNSYWIRGAWNSRSCASPTRWTGNYRSPFSFRDYGGESAISLLEVKQQPLVRTRSRLQGTTIYSGSGGWAGGHLPPLLLAKPLWDTQVRPGGAARNNNGYCTYIEFSFFCKYFYFFLGSQHSTELSKAYRESPLSMREGGCWTACPQNKATPQWRSHSVCAFHSTGLPRLLCALYLGWFPKGNKTKWKTGQKWKYHL